MMMMMMMMMRQLCQRKTEGSDGPGLASSPALDQRTNEREAEEEKGREGEWELWITRAKNEAWHSPAQV